MIFVLDTAIGLGVWVPFTIGKSTALLSVSSLTISLWACIHTTRLFEQLDPYRFLQLLHFPIRAMRVITDPVVDFILFLLVRFGLPFLRGSARKLISTLALFGAFIVSQVVGQAKLEGVVESLAAVVCFPS
jgi:E3 ubiquitin-protein ligase MARCH6